MDSVQEIYAHVCSCVTDVLFNKTQQMSCTPEGLVAQSEFEDTIPVFLFEMFRRLSRGEVMFDIPLNEEFGVSQDNVDSIRSCLELARVPTMSNAGWMSVLDEKLDKLPAQSIGSSGELVLAMDELWCDPTNTLAQDILDSGIMMLLLYAPSGSGLVLRVEASRHHRMEGRILVERGSVEELLIVEKWQKDLEAVS